MNGNEMTFPPDGAILREVRSKVRQLALDLGAGESVSDNLALVVDELVNNAIEHGAAYREQSHNLTVRIARNGDRLAIEFFDPEMPLASVEELARSLTASADGMPSLESERGRGLFLLSVYLDDLRAEPAPQGGLRFVGSILRK